jgi:hypothetical protein
MAAGRLFTWQAPDGTNLLLSDRANGFVVADGVSGLGAPDYDVDFEQNADSDGIVVRAVHASGRQIFLPMEVSAIGRSGLLARKQGMRYQLSPKRGPGYLYIEDSGQTYRIRCRYKDGMQIEESQASSGVDGTTHWQRFPITFMAEDPYFEDPVLQIENWGYGGTIPFFPILPLRVNPNQVLSDVAQPITNNYLLNPSFELNASNWSNSLLGSTPSTITRDLSVNKVGSWSGKIAASASSTDVFASPDTLAAALTIGNTYTFHGWVYIPSGQGFTLDANIFFVVSGPTIVERNQWTWFRVTFAAANTTEHASVNMRNPTIGEYFYTDALALSQGTITNPDEYIDGDQPFCHWSGTAHASESFRDALYRPTVVTNPGTVEAWPIWTIVGPSSGLTLQHLGKDQLTTLNYTLGSGEVATLDTGNKTVRLDDGTNLYRYLVDDQMWSLDPGDNAIRAILNGASAGSQINVKYNPRYEAIV